MTCLFPMKAIISKCFRQNTVLCLSFLFLFQIASAQKQEPPFQCKIAEEMPEFPGGPTALLKYISTNLKYPESSNEDLCGRIVARFVVNKSGSTGQVKIIRGCNNAGLEAAVIKLIQDMPAWKPGKANGTIVDCDYTLPISINLKE
ncbi:TonB family protein [Taibaiella lutea]|uniref:TonB family protein n=2 Tax=Taibaiella lutea TaxID=2608001 RepID=A0A5M6CFD9_9BACT|nr:TonB family protein [Taibaiella lutea]